MQNEVRDCLPDSSHDFMRISRESSSPKEKIMAVYLRAASPDFIRYLGPVLRPHVPAGFQEDHAVYSEVSEEKKSTAWNMLREKYRGYYKALENAENDNRANYMFLKDMHEYFTKHGMQEQARIVSDVMLEFEEKRLVA